MALPSETIVLSGSPFDAYDVISCVHCILYSMASIKGNDDDDDRFHSENRGYVEMLRNLLL